MLMGEKLDFTVLKDYYGGPLGPNDLSLFYYDIGFDKETGTSFLYQWSSEIDDYLQKNNAIIDFVERVGIPCDFVNNQILFSMYENEDNKAVAFFRHLRNAFCHYKIGYSGDFFCMEDFDDNNCSHLTMKGKIDRNIFYGLIDLFFKQKSKNEEDILKYDNPERE